MYRSCMFGIVFSNTASRISPALSTITEMPVLYLFYDDIPFCDEMKIIIFIIIISLFKNTSI